jgi:hypothetical protein
MTELVTVLLDREAGILQMPCPEFLAFGLDRGRIWIEKELRTPYARSILRAMAQDLVRQIRAYRDCGIHVLGIFGKNGSPSCGVEEPWAGYVFPGSGAFIEELAAELKDKRIGLEITGIRDSDPAKAIMAIDRWLSKEKRQDSHR